MRHTRRGAALALLVLLLGTPRWTFARGDEEPAAPAPPSDSMARRERAGKLYVRAIVLRGKGEYAAAVPLVREAIELYEQALGPDDAVVGQCRNVLATLFITQGAYGEARSLLEQVLATQERTLASGSVTIGVTLSNLGEVLREQGDFEAARAAFERALGILERVFGPEHQGVATALNNIAEVRRRQGATEEARALLERALAIRVRTLGELHPDVAATRSNLGLVLQSQGEYLAARRLFERVLADTERTLGPEHPSIAIGLHNLAALLHDLGDNATAQPLYERALAIQESKLGSAHPDVANTLSNLAVLLMDQGDYAVARPLLERSLALRERTLGAEHVELATSLNNLATLLQHQGRYAEARPLYERALKITLAAHGEDHEATSTSLNNLAIVRELQGDFAEAQALFERATAISERAVGPEHPSVATSLNNLAELLAQRGDHAQARRLYERALLIRERSLGPDHTDVATLLNNLAALASAQGFVAEARSLYERVLAITERHVRVQFAALGSRQRRALVADTRLRLVNWVAFAPQAGLSGYAEVLRTKGIVARAEAAERALARHASVDDLRLQEDLRTVERRAARLVNHVPPARRAEERATWREELARAGAQREALTRALMQRQAPLRAAYERLDVGLDDVRARLAPDEALVDVLRLGDRYVAWVVRARGEPARVELGRRGPLEAACAAFVQEAASAGPGATDAGAALRALVWAPIQARLGEGVRHVVLCPDAALAAVPFAALPGQAPGRYLADDLHLSYVMNAQDLVPAKDAAARGTGALLVGGVDYESAAPTPAPPAPSGPPALARLDRAPRGRSFKSLPHSLREVDALRERLGADPSSVLRGAAATEARLREGVPGRRIVHVATHGFAREDLLAGLARRTGEATWGSSEMERQLAAGHDPMLLSGLALAGANPREGGAGDDGILTALEASYLNLEGVDLVTLSACETARGTAESGEGVLGLVSAFQMAGATNVVASLWKVDDEGTRRLMEGFYAALLGEAAPLSPAEALREAALALRTWKDADGAQRFAAPRFWAAFVAYGR